jgi:hypothetical protein
MPALTPRAVSDYPLPPNSTIFGQLIAGEEVLDKIVPAPTGPQDCPLNPVEIRNPISLS